MRRPRCWPCGGREFPTMETSRESSGPVSNPLTSSQPATPASPSRTRGSGGGKRTRGTSGPSYSEPFALYDHELSCWRTSPDTGATGSDEFSETWPRAGTTRNGQAFERPMLVPPTAESGSSSSRNLPTPDASNMNDGEDLTKWTERRARVKAEKRNGNGFGTPLAVAVRLLPTPTCQPSTGNGHARSLGKEIRLLQTPTSSDAKGPSPGHARKLSETITRLPGASTPKPLPDGASSSESLLPPPSTRRAA